MRCIQNLLLTLAFLLVAAGPSGAGDPIVMFKKGDTAMNTAIAKARSTLPAFLKALSSGEGMFSIKAPVTDSGFTEHIWLRGIEVSGADFVGVIDNDPAKIDNVKLGDPFRIAQSGITDWMVVRDSKIYGAYTLRAMLDRLPKEQADGLRARLAGPDQEP
jgi:uncharacterized protein YegJ (DUF2314 family)